MDLFHKNDIAVDYIAKVEFNSHDEEEMEMEFSRLKQTDTRIILTYSLSSPSFACWFHKAGILGPQYVIIEATWYFIDIGDFQLPTQWPWCTKEMVVEVAKSYLLFGNGFYNDVKSGGMEFDELANFIRERAPESFFGDLFPPLFFDKAYAVGLILNETETILQQERNETLSNWLTNGDNFKRNGEEIVQIIKRASLKLEMAGMKGKYSLKNQNGHLVSDSFFPTCFYTLNNIDQSDVDNVKYDRIMVAYHGMDDISTLHHLQPIQWATYDGKPPKDTVRLTEVKLAMLPFALDIALILIGIILLLIGIPLCFYLKIRTNTGKHYSILLIIIGNILLICHIFIIPIQVDLSDFLVNSVCSAIVYVISIGFCFVICGILLLFRSSKRWKIVCSCLLAFNIVVMAIAVGLAQEEMAGESNLTEMDIEYVPNTDFSRAVQPKRWGCIALATVVTKSNNPYVLAFLILSGIINVVLLSSTGLAAFKITSKKNEAQNPTTRTKNWAGTNQKPIIRREQPLSTTDFEFLKKAAYCIYCQISIIIAAGFIALVQPGRYQFLLLILSIFSFLFATLDIIFILLPQLIIWHKNSANLPNSSVTFSSRTHFRSTQSRISHTPIK